MLTNFKRKALYDEFIFTHYQHFPNLKDVDEFLIKRLDENLLCNTILHSISRDTVNLAAGDSYKEFTVWAWLRAQDKVYGNIRLLNESEPYLPQISTMLNEKTPILGGIIIVREEGGYGLPNANEFGYGEQTIVTFFKTPKDMNVNKIINKEIERAKEEVKREADF